MFHNLPTKLHIQIFIHCPKNLNDIQEHKRFEEGKNKRHFLLWSIFNKLSSLHYDVPDTLKHIGAAVEGGS